MCFEIILSVLENEFDQINMCFQCLLKFCAHQLFLLASECGLHVCLIRIISLVSFHYLELRNRISYINLSKFMSSPMLRTQLHHSHISPSLLPSFGSKPNFFFFFFFFFLFCFVLIFFFFGLWIQLQVAHLALSSLLRLKHRLFMNFVRLVHILCSIWSYENGLIKQFKHKNQCPICNVSPSCFGYFPFLWKNYLNLYLKWHLQVHIFLCFFFFFWIFFFFKKKKKGGPNFISTHQSLLLVLLNVHSLPSWGPCP